MPDRESEKMDERRSEKNGERRSENRVSKEFRKLVPRVGRYKI